MKIGVYAGFIDHPAKTLRIHSIIRTWRTDDQKVNIRKIPLPNQNLCRANKDLMPFERSNLTDHGNGHPTGDTQPLASLFPAQIPFPPSIDPVRNDYRAITQTRECRHQLFSDTLRNGNQRARLGERPSGKRIGFYRVEMMASDEKPNGPGQTRCHSAKNIIPPQMRM